MEEYAKEKDIPIMQKDGITFLMKYIKSHNIKNILEMVVTIEILDKTPSR